MSEVATDLAVLIVGAGLGVAGSTLFIGPKAQVPTTSRLSVSLVPYGGLPPERTQNSVAVPAYQRPSVQILVRGDDYAEVEARSRAIYLLLGGIRNQLVNGTYYREVTAIQEPFDMGVDAVTRPQKIFNVAVVKRS